MPFQFLGFFTGDSKQFLSLAAWREAYGWDKYSAIADMQIDLDLNRLDLTVSLRQKLPKVATFNHLETDFFGKATGPTRIPGPLTDFDSQTVWKVDPRAGLA